MSQEEINNTESSSTEEPDVVRAPEPTKWTIMIFMAGDNNLSDDMIRGITEIKAAIAATGAQLESDGNLPMANKISVVIEFDGEHPIVQTERYDLTFEDMASFPQSSARRPFSIDSIKGDPEYDLDEIENRIDAFVTWAKQIRPADHYMLILSGHSDAFIGKTLLLDENPPGIATLRGLGAVIQNQFCGQLDILAFDGCVMNSIEVLREFDDCAKTWIGSEGSIPNFTWDYARIVAFLMRQADPTTEQITSEIITAVRRFNHDYSFGGRSVDISAIDLPKISDISDRLNFFGYILFFLLFFLYYRPSEEPETYQKTSNPLLSRILRLFLQAHWNCQTYMQNQAVDVTDFFGRLRSECARSAREIYSVTDSNLPVTFRITGDVLNEVELREMTALIQSGSPATWAHMLWVELALHNVCTWLLGRFSNVAKGAFVGADYQFSNGFSIFFPWSYLGMEMTRKHYVDLRFSQGAFGIGWLAFLRLFTAMSARDPLDIQNPPVIGDLLARIFEIFQQNLLTVKSDTKAEPDLSLPEVTVGFLEDFYERLREQFTNPDAEFLSQILDTSLNGTKDNPNRTRGFDNYLYYFSKTNNIAPILEVENSIPPSQ